MGLCDSRELINRFGKRDIKTVRTIFATIHQELQRKRCFAGPRRPLDKIQPMRGQPATQHIIQTRRPCRQPRLRRPSGTIAHYLHPTRIILLRCPYSSSGPMYPPYFTQ